ncbi:ribokinase [Holzapfeliella sp. He02]|uniref:Ribokinase n=1 Tax=Holzapfeliella saturejae TaxID=3082953 RepID=A0ABU8SF96_9LACO
MSTKNSVAVVGSLNRDIILQITNLPLAGETIHTQKAVSYAFGGKGSNQAVSCARNGSQVAMIGCLGQDSHGDEFKQMLQKNEINHRFVKQLPNENTGQAYILLQSSGQNSIVVSAEANHLLTPQMVQDSESVIQEAQFVLAQFEVLLPAIVEAFSLARANQAKTVLNPGPVIEADFDYLYALTDIIIPNETESEKLTGITIKDNQTLSESAEFFHQKGIEVVIITLGKAGVYYSNRKRQDSGKIAAHVVKAIDTTAAGDTFIGALLSQLALDYQNLSEAIAYANFASSLAVQKLGAVDSIPTEKEVKSKIKKLNS